MAPGQSGSGASDWVRARRISAAKSECTSALEAQPRSSKVVLGGGKGQTSSSGLSGVRRRARTGAKLAPNWSQTGRRCRVAVAQDAARGARLASSQACQFARRQARKLPSWQAHKLATISRRKQQVCVRATSSPAPNEPQFIRKPHYSPLAGHLCARFAPSLFSPFRFPLFPFAPQVSTLSSGSSTLSSRSLAPPPLAREPASSAP